MEEKKSAHNEENIPMNPPPYESTLPGAYPNIYPSAPSFKGYPEPSYPSPQPPGPTPTASQAPPAPAAVPLIAVVQPMGPQPTRTTCKSCHAEITSRVETKPNMKTHLFALLLCVVGLWCCFCIPYCMDSCMTTEHYCPSCNAYLGTYSS